MDVPAVPNIFGSDIEQHQDSKKGSPTSGESPDIGPISVALDRESIGSSDFLSRDGPSDDCDKEPDYVLPVPTYAEVRCNRHSDATVAASCKSVLSTSGDPGQTDATNNGDTLAQPRTSTLSSFQKTAEVFTQPVDSESQDASLRGMVLQRRAFLSLSPVAQGRRREVLRSAKDFPGHWLFGLRHYIVPLICGIGPTVVSSRVARAQLQLARDFQGALNILRSGETDLPLGGQCLSLVPVALAHIGLWGTLLVWTCVPWSVSAMKPVIRWIVPCFVSCMTLATLYYVLSLHLGMSASVRQALFLVYWSNLYSLVTVIIVKAGRLASNPHLKVVLVPLLSAGLIMKAVRFGLNRVLSWSDPMKALFVAVINPCVYEILTIMPARFLARSLLHNHSSTSFLLVVGFCFAKQWIGRSIVVTMNDPDWVLVLVIAKFLFEIVMRVSLSWRDTVLYNCLFSRLLPPGVSAANLLKHHRNMTMRAHLAAAETIGDIVLIWNGVAMVFLFDVSVDGKSPMNVGKALQTGLLQTVFEFALDYISVVLLSYQGINEVDLVQGRRWYWSAVFAPVLLMASSLNGEILVNYSLCYQPNFSEATFVTCRTID